METLRRTASYARLARVALTDAPMELALELARFQRTLGELERLQPGDVLVTGRRTGEPASVRVAGRVVAEGELVVLADEVGVRITGLRAK
jgi:flagellar motor switch/type III secretory pathway protein FliN